MLQSLLIDLDGTLLRVESEEVFFRRYLAALGARFSHIMPPREFVDAVIAATRAMTADRDSTRTNRQAWMADFFGRTGLSRDELEPEFMAFYREVFPTLRGGAGPMPGAREAVDAARCRGMEVVIATNPVFPRVAIDERIRWAGFDPDEFTLITSYEHMHFCKPHPEYYLEIAGAIGRPPEACLMVGNHPIDDMAAKLAGMLTYLLRDGGPPAMALGPEWSPPVPRPDYAGPLAGVGEVIARLGPAAAPA